MTPDPYAHVDGAYVLGMLEPDEAAQFEQHLLTCVECRARVAEVAPMANLLAAVRDAGGTDAGSLGSASLDAGSLGSGLPGSGFDAGPVPDTLLPALLRTAARERTRRRSVIVALGAIAAACVAALVVVLWPSSDSASAPRQIAFAAVTPSPVRASAALIARAWGTQIDLRCHYTEGVDSGMAYRLVVVDTANVPHPAGSWTLVPGHDIQYTGGTDVPRSKIAAVRVTLPDGTPILWLKP